MAETGCLAWLCSRSSGVRDRRTADYATRQWSPGRELHPQRLFVRDMILFHHRAEIGCRGRNRTSIRAFKGRCPTIGRPGSGLEEPEVVATSPYRIKSPVPVYCGV